MTSMRKLVLTIAALNFAYFFVEMIVALSIGSVSLFADSVDFLEDTAVNMLVFFALVWSHESKQKAGSALAVVILIPGIAAAWMAITKIINPTPPSSDALTVTAFGALVVNLLCAFLLAQHRHNRENLVRAAWLSARNDSLANILMIAAGVATHFVATAWWDIVVGIIIALVNTDAAKEVWEAAHADTPAEPEA